MTEDHSKHRNKKLVCFTVDCVDPENETWAQIASEHAKHPYKAMMYLVGDECFAAFIKNAAPEIAIQIILLPYLCNTPPVPTIACCNCRRPQSAHHGFRAPRSHHGP